MGIGFGNDIQTKNNVNRTSKHTDTETCNMQQTDTPGTGRLHWDWGVDILCPPGTVALPLHYFFLFFVCCLLF